MKKYKLPAMVVLLIVVILAILSYIYAPWLWSNKPTIKNIKSPKTLLLNQSGTWVISANDVTKKGLRYGVVWGDEVPNNEMPPMYSSSDETRTASFEHVYHSLGVFKPVFTVYGSDGLAVMSADEVKIIPADDKGVPTISRIDPESGKIGSKIKIYGKGFQASDVVMIDGGIVSVVKYLYEDHIELVLPDSIDSDCQINSNCTISAKPLNAGSHEVKIRNGNGLSNGVIFTVK